MKPLIFAISLLLTGPALATETDEMAHAPRVEAFARFFSATFTDDAMLRAVIRESTKSHRRLGWDEARALDRRWRDELADRTKDGLVDTVSKNRVSEWLKHIREAAPGLAVQDIYIIDGLGWNVGQTSLTADFFQGDERQWQDIIPATKDSIIVSELEDRGDGQRSLAIVSLPVVADNMNIGVVTMAIDVSKIP